MADATRTEPGVVFLGCSETGSIAGGGGLGAFLVIMAYNGAVVAFQFMHYMHFEMSTQWQLQRQGSRLTAMRSGM